MTVFAIDPGPVQSGWVIFGDGKVHQSGVDDNHELLRWVQHGQHCDLLAIESMQASGMPAGTDHFKTLVWVGRFQQAWRDPEAVRLVFRREVKTELCGNQQAKDANVRQAVIDRVGAPGLKAKPGPTYGVKSHAWSALAVAITALTLAACGGGDPEDHVVLDKPDCTTGQCK